jgi:hypothetical protein
MPMSIEKQTKCKEQVRCMKPRLIITIDVKRDNLWDNPTVITTENAHFIPEPVCLAWTQANLSRRL